MPVIRNPKDGQYYTGEGWSDDPAEAKEYKDEQAAQQIMTIHSMKDMEITELPQPDE